MVFTGLYLRLLPYYACVPDMHAFWYPAYFAPPSRCVSVCVWRGDPLHSRETLVVCFKHVYSGYKSRHRPILMIWPAENILVYIIE